MDSRTRKAIDARDGAVERVRSITWRLGAFSAAGALVLGAGFAHLLPTHLPHVNLNSNSGNTGNSNTGTGSSSSGNGLQGSGTAPGNGGSGGGQVTSGGS